MSLPNYNRFRRTDCIGIDAYDGVRVESATIIEITGEGKHLRPPPAPVPTSPAPPVRVPDSFGTPEALEHDREVAIWVSYRRRCRIDS